MIKTYDIPDIPGYYVSERGDVYSSFSGRLRKLKGGSTPTGYRFIRLPKALGRKQIYVHYLIAITFIGPRPSRKHQVSHEDGNNKNNHKDNLRWRTAKSNARLRVLHGTEVRGEARHFAKLTPSLVIEIRTDWHRGLKLPELAIKYPQISRSTIHSVCIGASWKHVDGATSRRRTRCR